MSERWCLSRPLTGRRAGFAFATVHDAEQEDACEQEALASESFLWFPPGCALEGVTRSPTNQHGQAIQIGSAVALHARVLFSQLPVPADASFCFVGSRRGAEDMPTRRQHLIGGRRGGLSAWTMRRSGAPPFRRRPTMYEYTLLGSKGEHTAGARDRRRKHARDNRGSVPSLSIDLSD